MSVIESTTSPLAVAQPDDMPAVDADTFDPLSSEEHREDVHAREVQKRPEAETDLEQLILQIDDINLARYMSDEDLTTIGIECVTGYRIDDQSREDWLRDAEDAMAMAMQQVEEKSTPWSGASNFIWPLITQASIDFAARTYGAIVQGMDVVKGVVWGDDDGTPITQDGKPESPPKLDANGQPLWLVKPGDKTAIAKRIGTHMSWQLLEEMPEWEPQTDQMLHQMPVIGGFGRKTFHDPVKGRNSSLAVSLFNLVWNNNATCFEDAPRHSEKILLYPSQILDLERTTDEDDDTPGGMFLHVDYGPGGGEGETFNGRAITENMSDTNAPHVFIEQHVRLDLDGDNYPEPYIVTVHLRSQRVVRIVANYTEDGIVSKKGEIVRIEQDRYYTLYRFIPSLDGGSYPLGFGHLLRALNEGINTSINQMFDAGTLANTGGGFIADTIGLPSGQTLFGTGKFHRVTTKGMAIRDAVYPIDFRGPNTVLFSLLGTLIQTSEKIGSLASVLTGDAAIANAPPTTVLALIEQGMKFYTGIIKRFFLSEKAELNRLHDLNKRYITEIKEYMLGGTKQIVKPDDYRQSAGVTPVADPTQTTDMQKMGRASVIMTVKDEPGMNRLAIIRRFLESASVERIDDLEAAPDPQQAQVAQAAQQLQMAMGQAQLGELRAKELKEQTQAFLNMALARKNASAQEEAWLEAQLTFMRLHIESLNTQVKAAAVDHRFHQTGLNATQADAQRTADAAEAGRQRAHEAELAQQQQSAAGLPTPGPTGPFPTPPYAPTGPDVTNARGQGTGDTVVPGEGPPGVGA